jgi:SMI1-KNR4 cell-wall
MRADIFRLPTDTEIDDAEKTLGVVFHSDYRLFLKGGGEVANATFEPAVVLPNSGYLDLIEIAQTAWNTIGLPTDLLPFVEDNGDYFCLSPGGEVVYWSHNGATNERWPSIAAWYQQVCVERR